MCVCVCDMFAFICQIVYFLCSPSKIIYIFSLSLPVPVTSYYPSRSNFCNNIFATVQSIKSSSKYIFFPRVYFRQFFLKCWSVLCNICPVQSATFLCSPISNISNTVGPCLIKIIINIDGFNYKQ